MASDETIGAILMEIADLFPTFEFTEGRVQAYARYLNDYDDDLLWAALKQFVSTSGSAFGPSAPQLRACATEVRVQVLGLPSSIEAWDETVKAPKPHPAGWQSYSGGELVVEVPYQWSNPLIERIARLMGWPNFPTSDEIGVDRAHFMRAYEAAVDKGVKINRQVPELKSYIEQKKLSGDVKSLPNGEITVNDSVDKLTKKLRAKT